MNNNTNLNIVIYNRFQASVLSNITNDNIDTSTPLNIILNCMNEINKFNHLTGQQKKEYVLTIFNDVINNNILSNELTNKCFSMLENNFIHEYIDNVYKLIKINNNISKSKCCF